MLPAWILAILLITGAVGVPVALDQLESKGVIDLPEDHPVWYAMERFAEKVECAFAADKGTCESQVILERVLEGYKYEPICQRYCPIIIKGKGSWVWNFTGIPDFCVAYCQNKYRVPEIPPNINKTKVCPMIYRPVICNGKKYPNKCFALLDGCNPTKAKRVKEPEVGIPEKMKPEDIHKLPHEVREHIKEHVQRWMEEHIRH